MSSSPDEPGTSADSESEGKAGTSRSRRRIKLASLNLPLPVTLISVIAAAVLAVLGNYVYRSMTAAPPPAARLEVDGIVVMAPDPALIGDNTTRYFDRLYFQLRNTGSQLAILSGVTLGIQQHAVVPLCFTQGYLPSTGHYRTDLPEHPSPGSVVTIPISQQIGPDEADRFDVAVRIPFGPNEAIHLYRLRVSLTYDRAVPPISVGEVIVALPFEPNDGQYFWSHRDRASPNFLAWYAPNYPTISRCLIRNSQLLAQFLSQSGIHSEQLGSVLRSLGFCCVMKAPEVYALTCRGQLPTVRPTTLSIGCTSRMKLEEMKWSIWTSLAAKGRGVLVLGRCDQSCDHIRWSRYSVTVQLGNPQPIARGRIIRRWVWSSAALHFPGPAPNGKRNIRFWFTP
jgi:hypothetical protein